MRGLRLSLAVTAVAAAAVVAAAASGAPATEVRAQADVVFASTQLNPIPEQEALRNIILKGSPKSVDFVPILEAPLIDRLLAESQTGKGTISLVGALDGTFASLVGKNPNLFVDLSDVAAQLQKAGVPKQLLDFGKVGGKQVWVPWMTATFVMAANKSALQYLPAGAKVNDLTYGQLFAWAKNIADKTGRARLGYPVGPTGLIHRYAMSYLPASFSGGVVTTFTSKQAQGGWLLQRNLWKYTHPQSLTYGFMQDPLLSGEVLVAWEHMARLVTALKTRPDDFVVFPSPRGPKGRAFMTVISGLAIPRTAPDQASAKAVINHLLSLSAQARTLSAVGFMPVVGGRLSNTIDPGLLKLAAAVRRQTSSAKSIPGLLPIGLGTEGGNYNKIFRDTFTEIVVKGNNPKRILREKASALQEIFTKTGAKCWAPDPPSAGPCQVG
jgi:multiple sugar transport system substrate-binding protein